MARSTATNRLRLNARTANALDFSQAVNSVVTIADNNDLSPEITNSFAWSAWVYAYQRNHNVLPRISEKAPHFFCIMGNKENGRHENVAVEIRNSANATTTEYWGDTRLSQNQWYNVTHVFNDSTGVTYLNGEVEEMTTLLGPYQSPLADTTGNFIFGNSTGINRNWGGLISDFRVWNTSLTASDVVSIFEGNPPSSGLVGQWSITENSGATVVDSSGNGYHGVLANAVWSTVPVTRTATESRSAASNRSGV